MVRSSLRSIFPTRIFPLSVRPFSCQILTGWFARTGPTRPAVPTAHRTGFLPARSAQPWKWDRSADFTFERGKWDFHLLLSGSLAGRTERVRVEEGRKGEAPPGPPPFHQLGGPRGSLSARQILLLDINAGFRCGRRGVEVERNLGAPKIAVSCYS